MDLIHSVIKELYGIMKFNIIMKKLLEFYERNYRKMTMKSLWKNCPFISQFIHKMVYSYGSHT